MNVESFYELLAGVCFALTGLWWTVVEGRKDWLADPRLTRLAGGVYASFLVPGVMSLGAQIGGENKLVWRAIFAVSALAGIFFTLRLLAHVNRLKQAGFFARTRWLVALLYAIVLVIGVAPELAAPTGFTAIQIEAFLVCLIILTGHGLAWELMTTRPE